MQNPEFTGKRCYCVFYVCLSLSLPVSVCLSLSLLVTFCEIDLWTGRHHSYHPRSQINKWRPLSLVNAIRLSIWISISWLLCPVDIGYCFRNVCLWHIDISFKDSVLPSKRSSAIWKRQQDKWCMPLAADHKKYSNYILVVLVLFSGKHNVRSETDIEFTQCIETPAHCVQGISSATMSFQ